MSAALFFTMLSMSFAGVEIVVIGNVQIAKTLGGTILVADSGVPLVQVAEVGPEWKTVLRTTVTDADGKWSLPPVSGRKIYYVRFTKSGFNEMRVRIKLDSKKGKQLKLNLPVST